MLPAAFRQRRLFVVRVCRWSATEKLLRLVRVVWARGHVGFGGYSAKVSLGLTPKLFHFRRGWNEFHLTLLGVRLHYLRSYGGMLT